MLGFLAGATPRPAILSELVAEWIYPDEAEMDAVFERLHRLGYPRVDGRALRWVADYLLLPEDRGVPGGGAGRGQQEEGGKREASGGKVHAASPVSGGMGGDHAPRTPPSGSAPASPGSPRHG